MHDSEQEHSGITGCRVTYESTIFYNEANKFSIIVVKTNDPRIPLQACSDRYYGDRMLRFTAVGYELPRTKAVELELDGEWVESKYGYQLQVEQWQEIVPQTADGLLACRASELLVPVSSVGYALPAMSRLLAYAETVRFMETAFPSVPIASARTR